MGLIVRYHKFEYEFIISVNIKILGNLLIHISDIELGRRLSKIKALRSNGGIE